MLMADYCLFCSHLDLEIKFTNGGHCTSIVVVIWLPCNVMSVIVNLVT